MRAKKGPKKRIHEEITPSSRWSQDSECHYLLVDLPGFHKDDIRLQVDNRPNTITVNGGRLMGENKYLHFEKTFTIPEDAHIDKITGKLEGEILCVNVPKLLNQSNRESETSQTRTSTSTEEATERSDRENTHLKDKYEDEPSTWYESEDYYEEQRRKLRQEGNLLETVTEKISEHRGILVTAILFFVLGVLVTKKFQPEGSE